MNKAPQKIAELMPLPSVVPLREAPMAIDSHSYKVGFEEGFAASGVSGACLPLFVCGAVMLVLACVMVLRHASRLMNMFCLRKSGEPCSAVSKKILSTLLPLVVCVSLAGCAVKQGSEPVPPVPLPPQTTEQSRPALREGEKVDFAAPPYAEDDTAQYVVASIPAAFSQGPRKGEPDELVELLDLKGNGSAKDTAVSLMRPMAVREAAQLVTLQTAMAWRYKQLLAVTEGYGAIMDTAFDFSPLVMAQGDALIMPPLLTRAGASMRIESTGTATAAETTYELLEPARYIASVPNWREFLMADAFPEPEKPHPAVLPKNDTERAIWRAGVREAWAQGLAEADQLYADNVSRMARNYRGVMLYHLLTAQHLLSRIDTASADLGMRMSDDGNKLNIGQKVYRITAPSVFKVREAEVSKADKARKTGGNK